MTEYTIVCTDSWLNTKDAVNEKIAEGWEPLGGVSVAAFYASSGLGFRFAQAMIRRVEGSE